MKYNLGIFSFLAAYRLAKCALDPYITGGSSAKYNQYPHSLLLSANCNFSYICGASVLNQEIVLTAAHCLEDCKEDDDVEIFYGHEEIKKMKKTSMERFVYHQEYDERTLFNDIGLILTKERLPLNIVKRVILMKSPPDTKKAFVAGWGADENMDMPLVLKQTWAYVQDPEVCKLLGLMPNGVFCAGPITGLGAANLGDSGSALIIDDYIQIGVVSYKTWDLALVAYTNVSYFMDWIQENSVELSCADKSDAR